MKTIVRSAAFLAVLVQLPGCVANSAMQELSKADLDRILIGENIENVSSVEQQTQDDGTIVLLVTRNRHETSFSGCVVDRTDIELRRSEQGWIVGSRSDFSQMALISCSEARNTGFASIEGNISPKSMDQSVRYLRQLVSGSLSQELISGSSELRSSIKSVDMHEVQSVFVHENGDIEFQVVSKSILPRLLGIRLSIKNGRLEHVYLNADNSIEISGP